MERISPLLVGALLFLGSAVVCLIISIRQWLQTPEGEGTIILRQVNSLDHSDSNNWMVLAQLYHKLANGYAAQIGRARPRADRYYHALAQEFYGRYEEYRTKYISTIEKL